MSLKATFTLKLGQKILPKTVGVGKLDGIHPSLVAGTANSKVFVHTPHAHSVESSGRLLRTSETADVSLLNVNQAVRAVAVGRLHPGHERDAVVVGTPTHVLAYDVDDNADLFYKEVPDGVNCIVIGCMGGVGSDPLAICGGNCAIQGFDAFGNDPFWTVTGDSVTALCLCDFDGDGKNELIVGSEDFDIRVFKNDEILVEITETEAITDICSVGPTQFAYCLANGTLGLYEGTNRIWRIKSKNHVTAIRMFDIDGDGEDEMVVGWSNGKIDFRSPATGEVLLKEQIGTMVAGMVAADYRMDGHVELICCSTDGEARGFLPPTEGGAIVQQDPTQEILHEFGMRKQNLLVELKNYEENRKMAEEEPDELLARIDQGQMGAIPTNTHLQTTLYVNPGSSREDQPCVELDLATSNDTTIRTVMVFAEGVFPGESHVVHPLLSQTNSSCKVQLRPEKDVSVDLHVKALIGYRNCPQYHVFELSRTLPRFSMYALCNENAPPPTGYVTVSVSERPQRLALWVNENFLVQEEVTVDATDRLNVRFFSLRGAGMLFIEMDTTGTIYIRCDDMELCGNVVQAVAEFFGLKDLPSTAEFPAEIERLMGMVEKANEMYVVRDRLSAEVADHSNLIKGLLVRAEDARLMDDMVTMRRYYAQLYNLNQELISQYRVRCNNHDELLACLKRVNQVIQKAGRLRVGKSKTELVAACREAIKNSTAEMLPKLIRFGV